MFPYILDKKLFIMKSSSPQSLLLFGAKKFLHSVKQIVKGRKTQQQCQFLPIFTFYQYIGKSNHLLALWIVLERNPWRKFLDVSAVLTYCMYTLCRSGVWIHMKVLGANSFILGIRKLWRSFPIKQKCHTTAAFLDNQNYSI